MATTDIPETIQGMQIDVPGTELVEHLLQRAHEHGAKATAYRTQAANVQQLQPGSGQTNDPVTSLQASQREHERKAKLFAFMAGHVNTEATYRLSERDLTFTEIIVDRWG